MLRNSEGLAGKHGTSAEQPDEQRRTGEDDFEDWTVAAGEVLAPLSLP